ncbi:MAG: NADH-quinone oxidoreductase subunit J [Ahniella sp.]|nr:NADH-quinone oxidoreductase subunit J [Ahniella sp.]
MTPELILFYLFAAVTAAAGLGVILSRNPVHSALCLVLTFFSVACTWLLIGAEFLAISLVLVYVGAVMVLFLFVVMMLDIKVVPEREGFAGYLPAGVLVAVVMLVEVLGLLGMERMQKVGPAIDPAAAAGFTNTEWIGRTLFTDYVLAFEVAALILTVALIAAVMLTLRKRGSVRIQDPAEQAATKKSDRLRLVDLPKTVADKESGA